MALSDEKLKSFLFTAADPAAATGFAAGSAAEAAAVAAGAGAEAGAAAGGGVEEAGVADDPPMFSEMVFAGAGLSSFPGAGVAGLVGVEAPLPPIFNLTVAALPPPVPCTGGG